MSSSSREASPWLESLEEALESRIPHDAHPRLAQAMRHALLGGGKRLRPQLVAAAARLGDSDPEVLLLGAVAVEALHSYSLVHDDLPAMDDDDWRRGRPSCHKVYGEAMAILAGDALQALAFEALAECLHLAKLPGEASLICMGDFARSAGAQQLVGGQAGDLVGAPVGDPAEGLRWIQERKTAALIRFSLSLGARLASLPAGEREALEGAGRLLGLAFQSVDDLLDAESSLKQLGKTPGKDQDQGKITVLSVYGPKEARRIAEDLLDEALRLLPPGARADDLRALFIRLVRRSS